MKKRWKILNLLIVSTWAFLLIILLYKEYAGESFEKSVLLQGSFGQETYWYGIYLTGKKIGFASTKIDKAGNEIILTHEREMKAIQNGKETILYEKMRCLCDQYYSVKSFQYSSNVQNGGGIKLTGEVEGDNILFFLESPEKKKTLTIPKEGKDFYLPITIIPAIISKSPPADSAYIIPILNTVNLSIETVRVVIEEIRPLKIGGDVASLFKIKMGNAEWWSNARGIIVKEQGLRDLILYSESEALAREYTDRILLDYTSLPFIKADMTIPDPEKLKILRVKIHGIPLQPGLYEKSTVVLSDDTLRIEKIGNEKIQQRNYTVPYASAELDKYINPDKWVVSDYKPLQDTGRIYAKARNNDAYWLAEYLTSYTFNLIRTSSVFVLLDSVNILRTLSGDYIERSIMYATYARAAGLPTRLVSGLVYLNGYFYFHTWPEVWFDKWIPVDPTFYQFPADVTHIPLKEGSVDEILSIIKELQSTTIEILEAA